MKGYIILRNCQVRRFVACQIAVFAFAGSLLTGCNQRSEQSAPPCPEVGVLEVTVAQMPLELSYTARTRGIREIEVRARVSGILLKRHYREGSYVKAGDLLFEIDPAPFAADVEQAKSELAVARAQLDEAVLQRDRLSSLLADEAVGEYDYNIAVTHYEAAKASVVAAQARLKRADLDLEYTRVTAPISGVTSCEVRSEGSLVEAGAESSLLTTITQTDRLYVDFSMPDDEARLVRTALAENPDAVHVRLIVSGGAETGKTARIEFVDTRVAADTGTVDVRAVFDNKVDTQENPNLFLSPGQFVRVAIEGIVSAPTIHIPVRAMMFGGDGTFVWTVDDKSIVKFQPVTMGPNRGNLVEIAGGLTPGDRVITDGILKVQPDMEIKPLMVTLEDLPETSNEGQP